MRFFPIIIFALLLPNKYTLHPPASFASLILFIVSLFLGFILSNAMSMILYSLMFYTTTSKGLFNVYGIVAEFFAGKVIPIPFMPEMLQKICYVLPFRLIIDLPFRTYIGEISTSDAIASIGIQILWTIVFFALGIYLSNKMTKRLEVNGG